jgi:hypothetical protein
VQGGKDYLYLIEVRPTEGKVHISSFAAEERDKAHKQYQDIELVNKGSLNNAVLVSVNSLKNLQRRIRTILLIHKFSLSRWPCL